MMDRVNDVHEAGEGREEFAKELRTLRDLLLQMAGHCEQMIARAVEAAVSRDEELARGVIEADHHVNRAELEVDELCLSMMARRVPLGADLRLIASALKMVTDLERIGDHAVNIAERAIDLVRMQPVPLHEGIPKMGAATVRMLKNAVDAFVDRDAAKAAQVLKDDDEVDDLHAQVFRDMVLQMADKQQDIEIAVQMQSIARYLERIGDHATNIAQHVVFQVRGEDIRHPADQE
jgi:phosphate transport system protein